MENHVAENGSDPTERANANQRALKNAGTLVGLRLLLPLTSFALVVVISRLLGAEGLGRYTLVFSFLTLFSAVSSLGLGTVVSREGAADSSTLGTVLPTALLLGCATAVCLMLAMSVLGPALGYDAQTQEALFLLSLAMVPTTAVIHTDGAFVALERMGDIAIASLSEQIVKVGGGIVVLLLGYGLESVLIAAVFGKVVALVISAILLARAGVPIRWQIDKATLYMLLKLAPTFLAIVIFARLYWRIDIIMLSKLGTIRAVGAYGAAYRLYEIAAVIPQSLCLALYPQIAAAFRNNPSIISAIGNSTLRYLIAIGLPLAVCTTILAKPILELLYGVTFRDASVSLTILIWTVLPYSIVRYYAHVLIASNHQRLDLGINVVMSIVNVSLNLLLIPRYGADGAAGATLICIVVYAILQQLVVRRYLGDHISHLQIGMPVVIGTVVSGGFVWLLAKVSLVAALLLTPLAYLGILTIGGFFSLSELKLFRLDWIISRPGLARFLEK